MSEQPQHDVAVLGCGNMGSAIARTALASGHRTVVWNRTLARTLLLQNAGATVATSPGNAIASERARSAYDAPWRIAASRSPALASALM